MKTKSLVFFLAIVAIVTVWSCDKTDEVVVTPSSTNSTATSNFRVGMRKLWEDHITWTRNVIFCLVDGLPGADQAVGRLLQNQDDIGNAIKPYYGNDAGNQLSTFLRNHIYIAAEVITAAKANNNAALTDASNRWQLNADTISTFLAGANPNWKLDDVKMMMNDHLKLTTDEVVARIQANYPADVTAYDKVHDEILQMADMLSDGIIKQFPDKF